MTTQEIIDLKYQYEGMADLYYPPKMVISDGLYSFFFAHKVNPLSSTWIDCESEAELSYINSIFFAKGE